MPGFVYFDGSIVTLTYQDHAETTSAGSSHSFVAMGVGSASADRYIIAAFGFRAAAGTTISSVTIGGVSATEAVFVENGTQHAAIYVALVPSGTTATVVINTSAICGFVYCTTNSITGIGSVTPSSTASSIAAAPTAAMSCLANGAIFGCANVTGGGTISATWSGLSEDSDRNLGATFDCFSSAHISTTSDLSGLACTCTFTATTASAGVFATFNPS